MRAPPLDAFLVAAKEALRNARKNKTQATLVLGNELPDLDSIASAIVFAYIRTASPPPDAWSPFYIPILNEKRSDLAHEALLTRVLPHASIVLEHLVALEDVVVQGTQSGLQEDLTKLFFVDHNLTLGREKQNYSHRVIGCIDHHHDESYVPQDTDPEPRIIGKAGSCTSLVVNFCIQSWEALEFENESSDAGLAKMALAAILVDTKDLTADVTEADTSAVEFLLSRIKLSDDGQDFDRTDYYYEIIGQERPKPLALEPEPEPQVEPEPEPVPEPAPVEVIELLTVVHSTTSEIRQGPYIRPVPVQEVVPVVIPEPSPEPIAEEQPEPPREVQPEAPVETEQLPEPEPEPTPEPIPEPEPVLVETPPEMDEPPVAASPVIEEPQPLSQVLSRTSSFPRVYLEEVLAHDFDFGHDGGGAIGISFVPMGLAQMIRHAERDVEERAMEAAATNGTNDTAIKPKKRVKRGMAFAEAVREFALQRGLSIFAIRTNISKGNELFIWVFAPSFSYYIPRFTQMRGGELGLEKWGNEHDELAKQAGMNTGMMGAWWMRTDTGRDEVKKVLLQGTTYIFFGKSIEATVTKRPGGVVSRSKTMNV